MYMGIIIIIIKPILLLRVFSLLFLISVLLPKHKIYF